MENNRTEEMGEMRSGVSVTGPGPGWFAAAFALVAVGLGVLTWRSATVSALGEKAGPFDYGIHFFAPPEGWNQPPEDEAARSESQAESDASTAPQATPDEAPASGEQGGDTTGPARPADLEGLYESFSPADIDAVRKALAPFGGGRILPIRLMAGISHRPPDSITPPRPIAVAVVSDADADRLLAPLVEEAGEKVEAYLGIDVPLADLLAPYDFAEGAADVSAATVPPSARCFHGLVLVRASAAGRFGLEPQTEAPNILVAELAERGAMEEAVRGVRPLWQERGISVRPVDLHFAADGAARWQGALALALLLAGGALLVSVGVLALARLDRRGNRVLEYVVAGARVASEHRLGYAVVVAAMFAALAIGAAWGGPDEWGDFLRQADAGPLAKIGLQSARLGPRALFDVFFIAVVTSLLLWALLAIGLPSLVPGLGLLTALLHNFLWGVMLAPTTLTFLERVPVRAAVTVVEGHAYALMAFGAWKVIAGLLRPQALGCKRAREGYAAGVERMYRMLPLVVAFLMAAAALEAALAAAVCWLG